MDSTPSCHFTFTGARGRQATISIADRKLRVEIGLPGGPDLAATADSESRIRLLRKETSLPWRF
jgi:hypothetical protein